MKTLLTLAFDEDLGPGDLTSDAIFKEGGRIATASIIAKQQGVLSGLRFAEAAFAYQDGAIRSASAYRDGSALHTGDELLRVEGKVASILKAERVALNGLQYLSGIATATAQYVAKIAGTRAKIYDTRKILPGWRVLAKEAVCHGGGYNHRMGLFDQFLIKENHIAVGGGIRPAIAACRRHRPGVFLEVEVRTLEECQEALAENPDAILLDNFSLLDLREAVSLVRGQCLLEASGGVNLDNVRAIALSGVDRISVGALTHSPKALDLSLLVGKN